MTLRVRFQGGPRSGEVLEFADTVERVVVGRDPRRCQVLFPPEDVRVGREHLALRRVLGRYRLIVNRENAVVLDGRRARGDEEIAGLASLRLGADGPGLLLDSRARSTLLDTRLSPVVERGPRSALRSLPRRVGRTQLAAIGLALSVVVASVGGYVGVRVIGAPAPDDQVAAEVADQAQQLAALEAALVSAEDRIELVDDRLEGLGAQQADGLARLTLGLDEVEASVRESGSALESALRAAARSVYLVMVRDSRGRETGVGTAWVAAGGTLATNAHVAETLGEIPDDWTLFVRSNTAPYGEHRVTGALLHPGYESFARMWSEYLPASEAVGGKGLILHSQSPAADVGLLFVERGDRLAPPLAIASAETLDALEQGDAVGFIGYPMERMVLEGIRLDEPTPTLQLGHVTAVTDFFLGKGERTGRQLIQYSMPLTGGASGSPIFNAAGEVVGLVNAMNSAATESGRVPLGVGVNFGQRADLLQELIDETADELQEERDVRWREELQRFVSARDYVQAHVLAPWLGAPGGTAELVSEGRGALTSELDRGGCCERVRVALPGAGDYLVLALASRAEDIDIYAIDPRSRQPVPVDTERDGHPVLVRATSRSTEIELFVVGPSAGIQFLVQVYRAERAGRRKLPA